VTIPHARKSRPCERAAGTIPNKNQTSSANLRNCGHLAAELPNARALPSSAAPFSLRPGSVPAPPGSVPALGRPVHPRSDSMLRVDHVHILS
jgi:hypothetical protein